VEAHGPKGEMFGFPRLRTLVAEHGEKRSLQEALLEDLYSFVGKGWEQEDDITLVTLRHTAASRCTSENSPFQRLSDKSDKPPSWPPQAVKTGPTSAHFAALGATNTLLRELSSDFSDSLSTHSGE
jgi:hypothetical protein